MFMIRLLFSAAIFLITDLFLNGTRGLSSEAADLLPKPNLPQVAGVELPDFGALAGGVPAAGR